MPLSKPIWLLFRLLLYAGPFLIMIAGAAYLGLHWNQIPDRFPIHWGAHGVVNGWGTRSFFGVFGALLIGLSVLLTVTGVSALTRTVGRDASRPGEMERAAVMRRATETSILLVGWFIALIMTGTAVWLPFRNSTALPVGFLIGTLGAVLLFIFVMVVSIVRAVKVTAGMGTGGGETPDKCWKAGIFYYNPDDKRLWVEKRFGIGWTMNMANRASWCVLGALVAVIVVNLLVALVIGWAVSR